MDTKVNLIRERVLRDEYEVDAAAVADAIIERLKAARAEKGPDQAK